MSTEVSVIVSSVRVTVVPVTETVTVVLVNLVMKLSLVAAIGVMNKVEMMVVSMTLVVVTVPPNTLIERATVVVANAVETLS